MPTIYTTGPAKVTVTERGGGGCLPWVVLLAVILASGAGAADHYLSEAEHVAVDVLEVAAIGAGAAVTVAVVVLVVRAVRAYRRSHPGRAVHVVTDAQWPGQLQTEARPMLEPTREPLTADAWADEQWRQDVKVQRWPGVPLEWSEPAGTWPDEWQQWGQR